MEDQAASGQLQELEKMMRVLQKKLERSEKERHQLESDIATKESLLKKVIHELQASQQNLEQQRQNLQAALEKMQAMQLQLIQSEKMSALGQTVAGIAHEINNPINFIHGNLNHLESYTQELFRLIRLYDQYYPSSSGEIAQERNEIDVDWIEQDIPKILKSMSSGTHRIRDIVLALRNFSRIDEVGYKAVDLHEGINNALMILQPALAGIDVHKAYAEIPDVTCIAGELNQVFMGILNNAIDAIAQRRLTQSQSSYIGKITIQTKCLVDQRILIRIADNGIGISTQNLEKIFDPFFTTKEVGQGKGLGLAIARQIIEEKHQGVLIVKSQVNEGTEFFIYLPIDPTKVKQV